MKIKIYFVSILLFFSSFSLYAGVSDTYSYFTVSSYSILANGSSPCTVTCYIRDEAGSPLSGRQAQISTSRGIASTTIVPSQIQSTNASGQCTWTLTSSYPGKDTISITCEGKSIGKNYLNNSSFENSKDYWDLYGSGDSYSFQIEENPTYVHSGSRSARLYANNGVLVVSNGTSAYNGQKGGTFRGSYYCYLATQKTEPTHAELYFTIYYTEGGYTSPPGVHANGSLTGQWQYLELTVTADPTKTIGGIGVYLQVSTSPGENITAWFDDVQLQTLPVIEFVSQVVIYDFWEKFSNAGVEAASAKTEIPEGHLHRLKGDCTGYECPFFRDGQWSKSEAICGGVKKQAINNRPDYRSMAGDNYTATVSAHYKVDFGNYSSVRLTGFYGIADGVSPSGVEGTILVDEKLLWSNWITTTDGWHSIDLDLSSYKGKHDIVFASHPDKGCWQGNTTGDLAYWADLKILGGLTSPEEVEGMKVSFTSPQYSFRTFDNAEKIPWLNITSYITPAHRCQGYIDLYITTKISGDYQERWNFTKDTDDQSNNDIRASANGIVYEMIDSGFKRNGMKGEYGPPLDFTENRSSLSNIYNGYYLPLRFEVPYDLNTDYKVYIGTNIKGTNLYPNSSYQTILSVAELSPGPYAYIGIEGISPLYLRQNKEQGYYYRKSYKVPKGTPISFDAGKSIIYNSSATITQYKWSFGDDNSTAYGEKITHTFNHTGSCTVSLTLTDSNGITYPAIEGALKTLELEVEEIFPDSLLSSRPNPFNLNKYSEVILPYSLSKKGKVSLKLYTISGDLVRTLIDNEEKPAGNLQCYWDGKNTEGEYVSKGIYLYQLTTDWFKETKKILVVK